MSNIELSKDGIKMPVWIVGVLGVMLTGWNGWISLQLLDMNRQLIKLQAHVEADIVTPGVQREIGLLRDRINLESETRNLLLKSSIENQKDIDYLKERLNSKP